MRVRIDDQAVSPVVGVILMVAITVVLGAVVFVLVNGLGKGTESAPNITFTMDQASRSLTVARSDPADWKDLEVDVTATGGNTCTVTLVHGGTSTTVAPNGPASASPLPVAANDGLKVASSGTGSCAIGLRYVPTNQAMEGTYRFYF